MQEQVHFEHETLGCLSSKSGEAVHFFWPGASASGALVHAGGGHRWSLCYEVYPDWSISRICRFDDSWEGIHAPSRVLTLTHLEDEISSGSPQKL